MFRLKYNMSITLFLVLCFMVPLIASIEYGLHSKKGEALELLKLASRVLVEGPYAQIEFIQIYKNPYNHAIETEFLFPRTESSSLPQVRSSL